MDRINRVLTIVLGSAAALYWLVISVFSAKILFIYPEVQVPFGYALTFSACLGWTMLWFSHRRGDQETRCRRCSYILRGLTEPRCPECGERI